MNPNPDPAGTKVRTLALILKFGHDLFRCNSVENTAIEAVNNSHSLLKFRSSALYAAEDGNFTLLGRYGTPEVNPHSPLCAAETALLAQIAADAEVTTRPISSQDGNTTAVILRLRPIPATPAAKELLWYMEFTTAVPEQLLNTAKLLGNSISEAVTHQYLLQAASGKGCSGSKRKRKFLIILLLLLLAGAMFIPVRESAKGEFVFKAPEITAVYAKIDAPVNRCLKNEGDQVKKGDLILLMDQEQLNYKLHIARSQLQEIEAELSLERNAAFPDQSRLGKVKLLEARRKAAAVAVEEALWHLQHTAIYAPCDGIITFGSLRPEELANRAVRTGDKLFEVLSGKGVTVEIDINERDASVLHRKSALPEAELFLHTSPEKSLPARITAISQAPELNAERTYCFKVYARPAVESSMNRYGMRGVAKLHGGKVALGYALFKSTVLYFRGW